MSGTTRRGALALAARAVHGVVVHEALEHHQELAKLALLGLGLVLQACRERVIADPARLPGERAGQVDLLCRGPRCGCDRAVPHGTGLDPELLRGERVADAAAVLGRAVTGGSPRDDPAAARADVAGQLGNRVVMHGGLRLRAFRSATPMSARRGPCEGCHRTGLSWGGAGWSGPSSSSSPRRYRPCST